MIFLYLAYLFFLGSLAGWVMEVVFRKFFSDSNPEHKWINPGFCVGPYVPLYGFGLCFLYLLADFGEKSGLVATTGGTIAVLVMMAAAMTAVEYIAGIVSLKVYNLRLWDYSNNWGNLNGIICPLFSAIWAAIGAAYYFLLHPLVTELLVWLGNNLEFLFVVGFFFGVFTIDIVCGHRDQAACLRKEKRHYHQVRKPQGAHPQKPRAICPENELPAAVQVGYPAFRAPQKRTQRHRADPCTA